MHSELRTKNVNTLFYLCNVLGLLRGDAPHMDPNCVSKGLKAAGMDRNRAQLGIIICYLSVLLLGVLGVSGRIASYGETGESWDWGCCNTGAQGALRNMGL